jgi:MSHA pilin protein MshC
MTLIEVIAVLLVLSIVGVVVLALATGGNANAPAQAAILKSHLRFVQTLAMANNRDAWTVSFQGGSYTLNRNGSPAALKLPNESSSTHTFPSGVSITSVTDATLSLTERGSPGPNSFTIVLNGTETIMITRNTGYIP